MIFDTIVGIGLLQAGVRHDTLGAWTIGLSVGAGLFAFSFFEYAMHRWLFHGAVALFEQGHLAHHERPMGYDALPFFMPPVAMLLLAITLYWLLPAFALLFSGAFACGYAAYGVSHWIMHSVRFRRPWLRRWAADHHVHHFHADTNFGVTSPLWDFVLGTRYVSARSRATMRHPGLR